MTEYLIFGDGWLGNKFWNYLGDDSAMCKDRISNIDSIRANIYAAKPAVVINCIGKTGKPNIDWCETHKEETYFSNVTVPALMAEACEEIGCRMVHIGSGCIYQGQPFDGGDWVEYDPPNFFDSYYSKTKIWSEKILNTYEDVLTLRIRMPFDYYPSPRNLINKLISYKQVIGDEPNSMTYVPDMLSIAKQLMNKDAKGIYNLVNTGSITHRQILSLYQQVVNKNFVMPEFITAKQLIEKGLVKAGRSNCVLSNGKLMALMPVRGVYGAMLDCMTRIADWGD